MGGEAARERGPSYWEYLRVDDLLGLQGGVEGDEAQLSNHEVLFIVVHQVYELWFKLAIRELESARGVLARDRVPDQDMSLAVASLRRVREVLDQAANHFRLMETLSTRDFLDFRAKLLPASGFQSGQLREIEVLLGLPDAVRIPLGGAESWLAALEGPGGAESPSLRRLRARMAGGPSLREAVDAWLWRTPIRGSSPDGADDAERVGGFVEDFLAAHAREVELMGADAMRQTRDPEERRKVEARYRAERDGARRFLLAEDVPQDERRRRGRIRAAALFLESYRELPLLAWPRELLDTLVAVEQAFVIFRQRHARMVEREIGRRTGTGGSPGVAYLDETALRYRVFADLWAVRTILVPRAVVPDLPGRELYDFRFDS